MKILVHFVPERAKHIFDTGKLGSALTLGTLISLVNHAAAIEGFKTRVVLGLLEDVPSLWAEIELTEKREDLGESLGEDLGESPCEFSYETLERRETNRGVYDHRPLPEGFLSLLKKQPGVYIVETPSEALLAQVAACEEIMWKNKVAIRDVFQWIHFTKKSYEQARSGMHVDELGVNLSEIPSIWLSQKLPSFPGLIYEPIMRSIAVGLLRRSLLSASGLIVITQKDLWPPAGLKAEGHDDSEIARAASRKEVRHRFVETGRIGMDVWLYATKFGMAAQPVTLSIIPYFWARDLGLGFGFSDRLRSVALAGPAVFRQAFQFDSDLVPAWGLRVGWPTRPKLQRSLRIS